MATRQQKYPNTDIFKYENRNPKNRITGDCVYRAISKALNKDWCDVVRELAELGCELSQCPNWTACYDVYLTRHGLKKYPQPRHADRTKYSLEEFIREHKTGTYVVNLPSHTTVVKNGKCYDIWDCTRFGGRVGNYWH